jgi:hypothetical protein
MHFELLVEELSVKVALDNLLPRILGGRAECEIYPHQGKQHLLRRLPNLLRGYSHWLPDDWKIVVLVDEDRQDCHALKQQMEETAARAGLHTKSRPGEDGNFQVINRIAIEELEAWFFGDVPALRQVYSRIPESLHQQSPYRDPDAIGGGTWEALERLLVHHNYFGQTAGMPKIEVARQISAHMNPEVNRSRSFQVFRDALFSLID